MFEARGSILATDQRRGSYRINYPLALEYTQVDMKTFLASSEPKEFNVSPYFTLQIHLSELEAQIRQMINKVNDSQPNVAACLNLLNDKIELIGATLSQSELRVDDAHIMHANISESGMAFETSESITVGAILSMKLIFPNDSLGLLLYGEVIRCEQQPSGWTVSVKFLKMPERCRIVLARTIMHAQMRNRQLEQLDPGDEDLSNSAP